MKRKATKLHTGLAAVVWSIPSDNPAQAARSKVDVARERKALGLSYDKLRLLEFGRRYTDDEDGDMTPRKVLL